jgi:hypothetical protein
MPRIPEAELERLKKVVSLLRLIESQGYKVEKRGKYGNYAVRESLFIGPSGSATQFTSTFQVIENGSQRFITTIPRHH